MELPVTVADWAATETRFKKQFRPVPKEKWHDDMVVFHEFVALSKDEREGKVPFIWAVNDDRTLKRIQVSTEMVDLAEERLLYWHQLKEMAGLEVPEWVRNDIAGQVEAEFEGRLAEARKEFEAKLDEIKATYPQIIARRLAEGLVKQGGGNRTVADLLQTAERTPGLKPIGADVGGMQIGPSGGNGAGGDGAQPAQGEGGGVATVEKPESVVEAAAAEPEEEEDDGLAMEPYIETARCTTCDECTNLNNRMFKYNDQKQAYIADPEAGTFRELVMAAERCPAAIIHPGTPLNKNEKDLDKWVKRAEPFN